MSKNRWKEKFEAEETVYKSQLYTLIETLKKLFARKELKLESRVVKIRKKI